MTTSTTDRDDRPVRSRMRPASGDWPSFVRHPLKVWPYTWSSLGWFVAAFVVMTAAWTAVGKAIVTWWEPSSGGQVERDIAQWFDDLRTDGLNTVADILSFPSDTWVKVSLMAILLVAFPLVFKRWHDWAFLLGALVLEVCVYGAASTLVGRERPEVEQLANAPTKSFPSGHMAAAVTFYVGLVLVVHWNTRRRGPRLLAVLAGVLIPIGMFVARLYLGMHFVTDMIGGILLGITSLAVALWIAHRGLADRLDEADDRLDTPQVQELSLTGALEPEDLLPDAIVDGVGDEERAGDRAMTS